MEAAVAAGAMQCEPAAPHLLLLLLLLLQAYCVMTSS